MRLSGGVIAILVMASAALLSRQLPPPTPPADVTLRIIIVETALEARGVAEALEAGEDFVSLARSVSVDSTAASGGMLGRLALSALRPELRAALQGVREGGLSPIVRVPTGFAILKVIDDAESDGLGVRTPNAAIASRGSIKYVLDVSGFSEATLALRQADKPDGWNQDPQAICRARTASLAEVMTTLEHDLRTDNPGRHLARPIDLVQAHFLLGQLHAYQGEMVQAIAQFELALRAAQTGAPAMQPQLVEALGIAHLHKAEMDNGLYHEPGHRCLLLHPDAMPLRQTDDLQKAIDYFSTFLENRPGDLEVRWLINVAHMAAGRYPDAVPPSLLIPPSAFESPEDIGRFVDVAPAAGLASFASAGGVIVDDFDNDGRLEVVTSSMNSCQGMNFFRRTADGAFVNQAADAGLDGQLGGLNLLQADYDNDGCLDILMLRGGWELPQRNSLLRNDCRGRFTDVTVEAGLATPATATQAAAWADVNNDGRLDLFVGNEDMPAQLFIQTRAGRFEDVAAAAGVNRSAFTKGVAAADYDNDGWVDLYASNQGGANFLYRNKGDGTFEEVAQTAGVPGSRVNFATWFFDYDNDGWQDLFVTSYYTSVEESARTYLDLPHNADTLKLYRNRGDGTFEDVSARVGLDKVFMPMGANFGDIDNDGFLDIYLGTGNPSYGSLVPSALLRNRGGRTFVDVTRSSGTGELHKGHGVAFADLNGDGALELVFEVGGATPGDMHALRLFENPGHGADWLGLALVGGTSNRSAIGARLTVSVETADGSTRTIHRTVGSGGSFGASPLQQHIGLGTDARRVDVEVWWPTTNTRQRFTDVGRNRTIRITELDADYTAVDVTPLPFSVAPRSGQEARR